MPSVNVEILEALAELEAQVRQTKTIENLDALVQEVAQLHKAVDIVQSMASESKNSRCPIYSLPNETLAAIFEAGQCLLRDQSVEDDGMSTVYACQYPILISHLSRRFRKVALQTTSLWTDVSAMSLSPNLLDAYIKRSGTRLLDVRISLDDVLPQHLTARVKENLPVINHCVARWRSFCFIARKVKPCYLIFAALKAFCTLSAPQLQFIMMDVGKEKMDDNLEDFLLNTQLPIFQGGAPVLTCLKGDGLKINYCCPPLAAVTTLELRDTKYSSDTFGRLPYDALRQCLCSARSLRNFAINPCDVGFWGELNPVEIPTLRSFEFALSSCGPSWGQSEYEYFVQFCDKIRMPFITSLTLSQFDYGEMVFLVEMLQEHSSSIFPALESLEFRGVARLHCATAFALLSTLPTISHVLMTCGPADTLLQVLSNPSENTTESTTSSVTLWPNLNSITILDTITGDVLARLIALITSRVAGKRPISKLRSYSFDMIPVRKLAWLRDRVQLEICQ